MFYYWSYADTMQDFTSLSILSYILIRNFLILARIYLAPRPNISTLCTAVSFSATCISKPLFFPPNSGKLFSELLQCNSPLFLFLFRTKAMLKKILNFICISFSHIKMGETADFTAAPLHVGAGLNLAKDSK